MSLRIGLVCQSSLEAAGFFGLLEEALGPVKGTVFLDAAGLMDGLKKTDFQLVFLDMAVLDVRLEEITRQVKNASPTAKILWLIERVDRLMIFDAICARADGYVAKTDWREMAKIAKRALAGEVLFDSEVLLDFAHQASILFSRSGRQLASLTEHERQVMEMLRQGAKNKEIAATLFVSVEKVNLDVKNVRKKLGLRSRRQISKGIPSLPPASTRENTS